MTHAKRLASAQGFSLTEVMTILTALSVLSGAAAPSVNEYIEEAKQIRAAQDVRIINVSLIRLFNDTALEAGIKKGWATYDLLVGAGAIPTAAGDGADAWTATGAGVGLLDDHLITNGAAYSVERTTAPYGWRGAYLESAVKPDPWGRRYAVNVKAMKTTHGDTVVLSAGADGVVESSFDIDGLPTRGDDVVALLSSGGGAR